MKKQTLLFTLFLLFLVIGLSSSIIPNMAQAADDENCLMCHKYLKMGRITEDGERKYYYVNESVFKKTVHNRVRCRDCHNYIDKLPHDPVKTGVTCNTQCHSIQNPADNKDFGHGNIYDVYRKSVHGRDKIAKNARDADKPYCTFCHINPEYLPDEAEPPREITDRCDVCHKDREFVNHRYAHTGRRIKQVKRSSKEIVKLCSLCHDNREMLNRHKALIEKEGGTVGRKYLYAAQSYKESFHGKLTEYGFKDVPNCLDCHAESENYYMAVHDIRSTRDLKSTTNATRKVETCKRCHEDADDSFLTIDPHPTKTRDTNPFMYWSEVGYNVIGNGVTVALIGLMLLETWGRRRDGISWLLKKSSTWRRKSKRGRDRI